MWKEIEEKYNHSYEEYALFMNYDCGRKNCNCSLYRFFDKHKIYILINYYPVEDVWDYCYYEHWHGDFCEIEESYKTRQEAEEAAFIRAFEILESR